MTHARSYVKYTFINVDPAWRRRSSEERAADKREFAAACSAFAEDHYLRAYTLVGTRGDCDLMIRAIGHTLDPIHELHVLTAFDLHQLHIGLAEDLERYATASALSEVMLRFAPPDPHPESFELLRDALRRLEAAPRAELEPLGFRVLWELVAVLGFAPSLDACVRDGSLLPVEGPLPFSTREGGALCPACAAERGATQLPQRARVDLTALLDPDATLPILDGRHGQAHRRLLARYIRHHLAEDAELPALDFWLRRPWAAA